MTLNETNNVPLLGLVLAGGKSSRMGRDKSTIPWHGREQRYHLADLLRTVCGDALISCRAQQVPEIVGYQALPDSIADAGPLSGILTAFALHPRAAWLVVACDLPLMDADTLGYLVANRDTSKLATTFRSPFDGLPEPLVTIWEPASYPLLRSFCEAGITCPRKVLLRYPDDVLVLTPPQPNAFMNANTPDDAEAVQKIKDGRGQ